MTFFITGNYHKDELYQHLPRLLKWLTQKELSFFVDDRFISHLEEKNVPTLRLADIKTAKIDLILTFGGDGTILYTAQHIAEREIPLLGFNLGGLGFLADSGMDQMTKVIEHVLHNAYELDERHVLQISDGKNISYAFNDLVFDKAGYHRVIELKVSLNQKFVNAYIADGLIVSTPTGSTGYNLSAGGPIVVPETNVNILTPICPHSLTMRPLVLPADGVLTVKVGTESDQFVCNADGQELGRFASGQSFTIQKAPFKLRLVKIEGQDIFSILRGKLRWGMDFRNKNRWSYNIKK